MKNTKENILKLIKAKRELLSNLRSYYKDAGETEIADKYLREVMTLDEVIWCFEDKEYFKSITEIYLKKEEK